IITAIGTLISGAVFLGTAALIVGLPGPFSILYYSVVLPAAAINTVTAIVIFTVVQYSMEVKSGEVTF
ncbi:MAG: tryptophan transporter, partial [Bacillota bacterium]